MTEGNFEIITYLVLSYLMDFPWETLETCGVIYWPFLPFQKGNSSEYKNICFSFPKPTSAKLLQGGTLNLVWHLLTDLSLGWLSLWLLSWLHTAATHSVMKCQHCFTVCSCYLTAYRTAALCWFSTSQPHRIIRSWFGEIIEKLQDSGMSSTASFSLWSVAACAATAVTTPSFTWALSH